MFGPEWIKALQLPDKITSAVAGACGLLLILDWLDWNDLSKLGTAAKPIVVVFLVLSAILFAASLVAKYGPKWFETAHLSRKLRESRSYEQGVLAKLDNLNQDEIAVLAEAVRNARTVFFLSEYDATCFGLCEKGLLQNVQHNLMSRNGYQFSFPVFVWEEITRQGEAILARDEWPIYDRFGRQDNSPRI